MKKILAFFVISMFFSVGVKAESSNNFIEGPLNYEDIAGNALDLDIPDFVSDISSAANPNYAPLKKDLKEWTVMFYSNAKDNLRYSQVWHILDMKKIGSTDKVNIVAEAGMPIKYADGSKSITTLRMVMGNGADSQYIDTHINALLKNTKGDAIDHSILDPLKEDIVKRKNTDMGNWKNIADFTRWAKANYPAKRYVFVIFGHGSGFFDIKKTPSKGISVDMETSNYVTLPEFSMLMKETGKVDALVMESCLMQMAEVAHQVKDYTEVVVGSSELMWSSGYDFKTMLEVLNSNPNISSEELGKLLATGYVDRVKKFNVDGGHASVINTSKLSGFVEKLNNWVDATIAADNKKAVKKGIKKVIRFDLFGLTTSFLSSAAGKVSMSGDLYDFVDIVTKNLSRNTPEEELARRKGFELMDYVSNQLIYTYSYTGNSSTGYDFGRAHGLSICIPAVAMPYWLMERFEGNLETLYWDLPFAQETKWGDFLKWFYGRK